MTPSKHSVRLKDIAFYSNNRINTELLNSNNYISTENMLSHQGGITSAASLPKQQKTTQFYKGDILISNIRPYFKKIWFATIDGGCSNDVLCLQTKDEIIHNRYLYYLLSQDEFIDYVMSGAKGSKMPRGDKNHILNFEILLPSLLEQKRIAHILSSIDAKIENNNKLNDNLAA